MEHDIILKFGQQRDMKKQFLIFSFIFLILSCSKKEDKKTFPVDELVLSAEGLHEICVIKFSKTDTVYFQRIFPEPVENFYAILNNNDKEELNKLLYDVNFEKFDTTYVASVIDDAQTYLINISNQGKKKSIYLYADDAPEELNRFIKSLGEIKENLKFIRTNKTVDFGNLKSTLPPPPPPIPSQKGN